MTISAVIVTYQTEPAELETCLNSLKDNGIADIVIADNSPSQAMERIAEKHTARYLPQSENRGFAAAANHAASFCVTDSLLLLNPDAYVQQGAIRQAQQYLARNDRCGAIGLLLSSPAGVPELRSFGATVTPLSLVTRHFTAPRLPTSPQTVGWVSGGAIIIRRHAWQQVGGFDPGFFLYWEDVDLCRRLTAAGWEVILLPPPGAIHRRGASLTDPEKKAALYDQSADKYFAKHYAKTICLPLHYLRYLYRLLGRLFFLG